MKKNNSEFLIWGFTPEQVLKGLGYVKDIFLYGSKMIDSAVGYFTKKLELRKENMVINAETKVVKESPCKEKEEKSKKKSNRFSKVILHFSEAVIFEDAYIRISLKDGSIIDLEDEIIKSMEEFQSKLDELNEKYGEKIERIDLLSVNEMLHGEVS